MLRSAAIGVSVLTVLGITASSYAAVFSLNSLAVIQAGDGSAALANNSVYSVIELTKAAGQAGPVQTISISGQSVNPMWTSATATSTAYLSATEDRSALVFTGHTQRGTSPFPNINTITPRGLATIDGNGVYTQQITYTGSNGNQTRSGLVFSNGNTIATDQGGFYISGGASPALAGNFRNTRIFGGVGYALQQSTTNIVDSSVGGTLAAPTVTALPGLPAQNAAQDFYMLDSDADSAFDLLYITTNTSATVGSILKYQLVSGSWTARGSAATTGLFGLAAEMSATGAVNLYATSGNGASNANSVLLFVDTAGAGVNISLGAATTLFTTPSNSTLKGIELIPAPGSIALLSLGGLLASRRRR